MDHLTERYLTAMGATPAELAALDRIALPEAELALAQLETARQHPEESPEQCMARARARLLWKRRPHRVAPGHEFTLVAGEVALLRKLILRLGIAALLLLAALVALGLLAMPARAQVDVIRVTDGGTPVTTFAAPFTIECGANLTCTRTGGTSILVMDATGGSGSGCVPPGTATRLLYDDGAGGCLDTGLSWSGTTLTVPNSQTITFSGTGSINARKINGVEFTNAESLGKIPIGQGDGTAAWADPLVQGLTAHDAPGAATNPVAIGCYASAGAPADVSADTDVTRARCDRSGTAAGYTPSVTASGTLGALDAAVSVAVEGRSGASIAFTSGSLTGQVKTQYSYDGGTSWFDTYQFSEGGSNSNTFAFFLNPSGGQGRAIFFPAGATHVRAIVSAYTSGSVNATLRATALAAQPLPGTFVDWTTGTRSFVYGSIDNGSVRQQVCDGAGNDLCAGVTAGLALRVDGSAVTQPVSGTVTANAGTGTFTVGATDLDIRNLSSAQDSVAAVQSGSWTVTGSGTFNNQQSNVQVDYDTSAGTQNLTVFGVALPASGGAVAGGTASNPIRVDPVGTTTQPVSGTVTANAGTNLNTSALLTNANFQNVLGTASLVTTAALADDASNDTDVLNARGLTYIFDGTGWDRWTGAVTANNLDIRDLTHTADSVRIGDGTDLALVTAAGELSVNCGNCSGSGASAIDNTTFTAGSDDVAPAGFLYDTTPPAITDGTVGLARMDANRNVQVNCVAGCSGSASDTTGSNTTLDSLNDRVSVALAGQQTASVAFATGSSPVFTVTAQCSYDNGSTWRAASFVSDSYVWSATVTNPSATERSIVCLPGATHAGAEVTDYTSGSTTAIARAVQLAPSVVSSLLRNSSGTEIGTASAPVRTDPTGTTTQPISGTVTANAGTNLNTSALSLEATQADVRTSVQLLDDIVHSGDATLSKYAVAGAVFDDTSPASVTENNAQSLRMSSRRALYVETPASGTFAVTSLPNVTVGTFPDNEPFNAAQWGGNAVLAGNGTTGTGSPRVTIASDNSNAPGIGGSATGSAVPSAARYIAGNGTGNLTGYLNCDNTAIYDASTNGSTQLVALTSGQTIYVCGYQFSTSQTTAVNVNLRYGTGTNCATGATNITPSYPLQAASSTGPIGLVVMTPGFTGLKTAASNALCINTNAAVSVQAIVWYTKF